MITGKNIFASPSFDVETGNKFTHCGPYAVGYYRRCGVNVMPLKIDGSRKPRRKWKEWKTEAVPYEILERHFKKEVSGIGIICGESSGNLECLDFDCPLAYKPWIKAVAKRLSGVLGFAPLVATPSGGRHVYWRCDVVGGNEKVAMSEDSLHVIIETRGQGGFAVGPGSPTGTHSSGRDYRLIGGSFERIPRITPAERAVLLEIARSFDLRAVAAPKIDRATLYPDCKVHTPTVGDVTPWDDFNAKASWEDILVAAGWTCDSAGGETTYWTRPGKGEGVSATTGHCGELMYVFSSSAAPLESNKSYSKFAAFTFLFYSGDFSASCKTLVGQGFGSTGEDDSEERINQIIKGYYNG